MLLCRSAARARNDADAVVPYHDPQTVLEACQEARGSGASVFFDPGPRCWTMREGPRREALDAVLAVSDGVLVTEEEGEVR